MKAILFLIFCIVFFSSCKKDNLYVLRDDIAGSWEFRKFIGYPFNYPPSPPGNGKIIIIEKNGTFKRKNHDTLIFKGIYFLKEKKDCYGNIKQTFFQTTEPNSGESVISVMHDTLFLSSPNCLSDGGTLLYKRN